MLLALISLVFIAQANLGVVEGIVTDCTNGPEQFVYNATVMAEGNEVQVKSDLNGQFALPLFAGIYTITATDPNGSATRHYVPVDAGQTIDIGILDISTGMGCDLEP